MTANTLTLEPAGDHGFGPFVVVPGDASAMLGRGSSCAMCVDDGRVSSEHARLEWTDDAWRLHDLDSRNGTFLNDRRLTPGTPQVLRDGDTIGVGPCVFRVRWPDGRRTRPDTDRYTTRASLFGRVQADVSAVREQGWEEFRDRYAPVIVGFARNSGLPAQDIDDVLQDVMLGFFRVAPGFNYDPDKGRFRGYLKRATLNAIRKRARASRAREEVVPDIEERLTGIASQWDDHWTRQLFARALDEVRHRFDARTFEAFELYAVHGVPADEVAARLDMSANSVHQAKSRVQKAVQEIVDRMISEEG